MSSPTDTRTPNVVLGADVSNYSQGISAADQQTRGLIGTIDALTARVGKLNRATQSKLTGFATKDALGLTANFAAAATFEKQLGTLNATAKITGESMRGTKKAIEDTFTSLPVSRTQVIALTESLTDLGVKGTRELEKLDKTYTKLGAATGEGPILLANGLQQLNRLMGGASADQTARYANSLLTVSKTSGVAASGVLDFSQQIAPLARQAGIGETAVLGISAAFVKAGQDGRVAQNAFNSIIYDITRSIQTGSPEIAKYANLLGLTAAQFKNLPGEAQITQVLSALGSQGARGARTLESWGMEGVRTQSAIAAVTQSGGLDQAIADAMGASNNTRNLDKGAKAAMSGFVDETIKARNQVTQMATVLGTTFLTPVTKAADGMNVLLGGMRSIVQVAGPFIAGLGAGAGALAGVASIAMHAAGIIGTIALGRLLTRSTGFASFSLGRAQARGTDPAEYTKAQTRAAEAERLNRMNWMQRRMLASGTQAEQMLMNRAPGQALGAGQLFRMAALAPLRTGTFLFNDSSNLLKQAFRNDFQRQGLQWGEGGGPKAVWRNLRESAARGMGAGLTDETGRFVGAGYRYYTQAVPTAAIKWGTGMARAGLSALGGADPFTAASTKYNESMNLAATKAGLAGRELNVLAASTAAAGAGMKAFGVAAAKTALMGTARLGVAGVGMVAGGAMNALSKLGSFATSPLGLASIIGGGLIYSHMQDATAKRKAAEEDPAFQQPIRRFNDQLGIATAGIATFTKGLDQTADLQKQLNGVTAQTSTAQVKVNTNADVLASSGMKVTPGTPIAALAKVRGGKTNAAALGQLALAYNFTDPRQIQLFKQQANAAGFDQQAITQALGMLPSNLTAATPQRADYSAVTGVVAGTEGQVRGLGHLYGGSPGIASSAKGADLRGATIGGILDQYTSNQAQYGTAYAAQKKLVSSLDYFADYAKDLKGTAAGHKDAVQQSRRKEMADAVVQAFGLDSSDSKKLRQQLDQYNFTGKSREQIQQEVLDLVGQTTKGATQLSAVKGTSGTTLDPTKFTDTLTKLFSAGLSDAATANIRLLGPVGQVATRQGGAVQEALLHPEDPQKVHAGLTELTDTAVKTAGGLQGAYVQLGQLEQAAGSTTSQLYQLAQAAQSRVAAEQAYQTPQLSRAGQFGQAVQNYAGAQVLAGSAQSTTEQRDAVAGGGAARNTFEAALESQRQFEISSYQMAKSYGKQMERAGEDEQHQIMVSNRDFWIQMGQTQSDYQKQQLRSREDFARSLVRQAEDTAKTIYNPFQRVNAEFTTDAGTVLQNLQDQNGRIQQQMDQLNQLRKMGLSQGSIDTLQLSDPNNAQQVNNLAQGLVSDPGLIAQINAQIKTRMQATTSLTQNDFVQTFRRTVEDFTRESDRSLQDFNVSQQRAIAAQQRGLDEMAYSFHTMVSRSQTDLADSMEELTGTFGDLFPKTMDMITTQLGKYAPQAAAIIATQLDALKSKYDNIFNPPKPQGPLGQNPMNSDSTVGATGADQQASLKSLGRLTAGVYYKSSSGAIVVYQNGSWTKANTDQNTAIALNAYMGVNGVPGVMTAQVGGLAAGGVVTAPTVTRFAETGAEAAIPLNATGHAYMADSYRAISRELARSMGTANRGVTPTGGPQQVTYDYSTSFTGPISVVADNPNQMLAALAAKKRIARLSRPGRAA